MKILLAEDETDFAYLFHKRGTHLGHDCTIASTYAEIIEKVFSDPPDIILMDVFLPGKNGLQIAKEIRSYEATKEIPIIVLTGLSYESLPELSEVVADGFLIKNTPIEKILKVCEEHLKK